MSYFDHVKCTSCGAAFDPEKIRTKGDAIACPYCGASLSLRSLFGLAAHWDEEAPEEMTLDDLVPGKPAAPPAAGPEYGGPRRIEGPSAADALRDLRRKR
jgi:DNA-directed RNA polymerase subunit RPC12/RpoP